MSRTRTCAIVSAMRKLIKADPFSGVLAHQQWPSRGTWPCHWVTVANVPAGAFVAAYRLRFKVEEPATLRIHVTADERYDLFLDGARLGRGPERGDVQYWFFETFDLDLAPGEHLLVAKVWSQGDQAPLAQMSLQHGFLLAAEGNFHARLSTGVAPWEATVLPGVNLLPSGITWGAGAKVQIDGKTYPWGIESGSAEGFEPVRKLQQAINGGAKIEIPVSHRLRPATLPAQLEEPVRRLRVRHVDKALPDQTERTPALRKSAIEPEILEWQRLLDSAAAITIPAHSHRRILLDFEDYQCVYPAIELAGGTGSRVRMHWAEGLYEGTEGALSGGGESNARGKGNRDEVENKCFIGVGDVFLPFGKEARRFETLWWSAGRYVEISIATLDEPLIISNLTFAETRYPLNMTGSIGCDDPRWDDVVRLSVRTLQNCAHETYMDCPYYEQLQYLGDTRLQALVSYVLSPDDRLAKKALLMGFASILSDRGLTQSRYPSRSAQIIPPFSLWWVSMLYDHGLWRGDKAFAHQLMPAVRFVLDTFLNLRNERGLMNSPPGWNFTDWVPQWTQTTRDYRNWGVPPDGEFGISSVLNWHLVYTLNHASKLEAWLGEPELSARYRTLAADLARRIDEHFWNATRNLYADDLAHVHFSQHAQCLAILSDHLPASRLAPLTRSLFKEADAFPDMARATIYFTHYFFEAAAATGNIDSLFSRMEEMWFGLPSLGLKALPEEPEPCRSDCHAWGAHPLYHFYASVLGIRPAALGDPSWIIRPQLGPLYSAHGELPHPGLRHGVIKAEFRRENGRVKSNVVVPEGTIATIVE